MRDDDLLRFDESRLGDHERARAEAALRRFGPAFRFQLVAAMHLEGWAEREEQAHEHLIQFDERHKGYVDALREVAAHLRQGDYLPGGLFYEETVKAGAQPRTRHGGWRQIVRNLATVRSYLHVVRVLLEAGRLLAHAAPPEEAPARDGAAVASHYDNARRFLDRIDGELDAAERLSRPGAVPEPTRRPAERRSGFDRRRGGDRRGHSTVVTVERRRGGR